MIEIEITETIFINEKELVDTEQLSENSTDEEIAEGVYDYILGLDDSEYYPLVNRQKEICEKIKKYLKNT